MTRPPIYALHSLSLSVTQLSCLTCLALTYTQRATVEYIVRIGYRRPFHLCSTHINTDATDGEPCSPHQSGLSLVRLRSDHRESVNRLVVDRLPYRNSSE